MQSRLIAVLTAAAMLALAGAANAEQTVIRYVRFAVGESAAYGVLDGQTVHELSGTPFDAPSRTGRTFRLDDIRLLPPTEPSKVLAVALNFRSHAGDSGAAKPELFAKLPSSLIGDGEPIVPPAGSSSLHYEGELVVVIGKTARRISPEQAPDHVFGVTAGNDVSERVWQSSDVQWLRAKASDSFGPVGPVLVAGLDYHDLLIETRLNGAVQQSESTKNLIHDVDEIVSFASQYFTLLPGDMIFTGTPGRTRAMRPGDVVEITIQGVGTLRNPVAAVPSD